MPQAPWHQHNITFADREAGKPAITGRIGPTLRTAEEGGQLADWWFMNKQPWRLRYRALAPSPLVEELLNDLAADGTATAWSSEIYEQETDAFGGPQAMDTAHDLFHQDSRHLLGYQPAPGRLGRRETAVLLISTLMRAARLDWFEQGDVWAKASTFRPPAQPAAPELATALIPAMHKLMTADAHSLCRPSGPLEAHAAWIEAFERAGTTLARLAAAATSPAVYEPSSHTTSSSTPTAQASLPETKAPCSTSHERPSWDRVTTPRRPPRARPTPLASRR